MKNFNLGQGYSTEQIGLNLDAICLALEYGDAEQGRK